MDGERLRQLRRSRGWDVPELAARIRKAAGTGHVADHDALVRMIRRWEAGQARMTERYALLVAKALGLNPADPATVSPVPGVSSWPSAVTGGEDGEDDPVNRREFSIAAFGVLAGNLIPPARVPASVSPEHVQALQAVAADLWTRDRQVGGSALLREAAGYYVTARSMLDSSSYSTGRARESLRFLDQASHVVRQEASPKVHAIIAMRRATATALLGDEPGVRRNIAAALRELDQGEHYLDPHWAGFATVTEVTAHEAMAFLSLGKPGKAADVFRLVLADKRLTDRNRAYYQARLAGALDDAGDRTQAVTEGLKVLPDLEGPVKSVRTVNWLRPIRERMPRDSEFAVRFDAVAAS